MSDPLASALYVGAVLHHRRLPREHRFRYPVFMAYLDVDRLDELAQASPFVSRNRFNWASIYDADFLQDCREGTLRAKLDAAAQEAGQPRAAQAFLLGNLRYLGWCFNPVAYLYGFDAEGQLQWICAEVTNTPWKERHRYWMCPKPEKGQGPWAFDVPKQMHVSPFMPMDLRYRWAFARPGAELLVHMGLYDKEVLCFDANLKLERRPWSASQVYRTLLRYPWMTLKVVTAIHWEALWLWMKRVPIYTHPNKVKAQVS